MGLPISKVDDFALALRTISALLAGRRVKIMGGDDGDARERAEGADSRRRDRSANAQAFGRSGLWRDPHERRGSSTTARHHRPTPPASLWRDLPTVDPAGALAQSIVAACASADSAWRIFSNNARASWNLCTLFRAANTGVGQLDVPAKPIKARDGGSASLGEPIRDFEPQASYSLGDRVA